MDSKKPKHQAAMAAIGFFLAIILVFAIPPARANGEPVVIVNSRVGISSADSATLRGIFSMAIRAWPDRTPVRVFVLPTGSPIHGQFCRTVLGLYPYQLQRAWDRLLFAGVGTRPTVVTSLQEMLERVRTVPGAIGYIDSVPDVGTNQIKVVP